MQDNTASLSALIGSRICHDLISPIGAIANGLELMQLSGDMSGGGPEMLLITDSCAHAQARIRFFRIAFGTSGRNAMLGHREVISVIKALEPGSRVRIDWQVDGDVTRRDAQLCFLAVMCCETAMPKGGDATVTHDHTGWTIRAMADRMAIDRTLWSVFDGAGDIEFTPAEVQFPMLSVLLGDLGREVTTELRDRQIIVHLSP